MRPEIFEIVRLGLQLALLVATAVLAPRLKTFLEENTTQKQRAEALFWTQQVVKVAEQIYKERGQGELKKEYVLKWLQDHNIKLDADQLEVLITLVVAEFNKKGWAVI